MKQTQSMCEDEIERVIGRSALITLEKHYGRSYLYIKANKPAKELVKLIGKETFVFTLLYTMLERINPEETPL